MSKFVIELSENKASLAFLNFIKTLSFVKKVDKVTANELDNRIITLSSSIKKNDISEEEILNEVKEVRRKRYDQNISRHNLSMEL